MSYRRVVLCGDPGFRAKHCYRSPAAARKALKRINSATSVKVRSVYRCRRCGSWHISKQEQR